MQNLLCQIFFLVLTLDKTRLNAHTFHQKCFLSLTADIFNNQVAVYTSGVSQLEWRESGKLPEPQWMLRVTMVDNVLYVTGGGGTSILSWEPTNESWEEAGNLAVARFGHAAVAVPSSMIESGCLPTTQTPTLVQPRAPTPISTPGPTPIPTQTPPTPPLTPLPRQGSQP